MKIFAIIFWLVTSASAQFSRSLGSLGAGSGRGGAARFVSSLIVAICCLAFVGWDHGCSSCGGTTAQRVQPLVTSIGVNTHIYMGGVYSTSNIISDLSYLGLTTVRDYPRTYFSQTTNYDTLAAAGVKFDFDTAAGNCNNDTNAAALVSDWASFIASYPGALVSIEGLNEINNQPSCYLQAAATNNTTPTSSAVLHFGATLASLLGVHAGGYDAGMTIVDTTTGSAIPTNTVQSSAAATTVTMNANAAGSGVGNGDTITFEANASLTGGSNILANNAAAVAFQQGLYNGTHASVSGVNVLNFTTCCSPAGTLGSADYNNMHFYSTFGSQPLAEFSTSYNQNFVAGLGPVQTTETGFYTAGSTPPGSLIGTDGVDNATQARYLLMTVMDFWSAGIVKTYIYEMADEACDAGNTNAEDHYGLFDCSNNPKTAATAFQNFHTILNDSGGTAFTFTPGQLNYTATGLPAPNTPSYQYGGYQLLFQKSNGHFEIVLWNELNSWGYNSGETTPTPSSVTITLGTAATTVNVYDPVTGGSPTNTYSGVTTVNLSLTTDMQIVEVIP